MVMEEKSLFLNGNRICNYLVKLINFGFVTYSL